MQDQSPAIAIIDDDEIFQMLIKGIISKALQNPILQFLSGFTALRYLKENTANCNLLPFVFFLDITMPGITGWDFLKEFEKINFTTGYSPSIFILTGSSNIDFEKLRAFPFINGYLTKPVAPAKFIEIIQESTNNKRADIVT